MLESIENSEERVSHLKDVVRKLKKRGETGMLVKLEKIMAKDFQNQLRNQPTGSRSPSWMNRCQFTSRHVRLKL